MKYSVDKQEHYSVVKVLEDNLNSQKAPDLKSEFLIMKNEGIKNLILDISDVRFIDSSGLSAILTAHRLWPDEAFILTGLNNPTVKSLISVSRLDNVFTIIPTVEESIAYVTMNQIGKDLLEESED